MPTVWQTSLLERLADAVRPDGAWGYARSGAPNAEPTALATLALASHNAQPRTVESGLAWLAKLQQPHGGVPITPAVPSPCWPTAFALLTWLRAAPQSDSFTQNIERAADWLLNARGEPIEHNPDTSSHDPSIVGWAWVGQTHSWIEPTAYATLALRARGRSGDPRLRDAVRLILDRAIPAGGWNYGNARVLQNTLRPFPATTGVALAALAGEPKNAAIDAAIAFLTGQLERVRSPLSLSWGLIGLRAWNALPSGWDDWLAQAAERVLQKESNAAHDALLILAAHESCPLIADSEKRDER